MNELDLYDAYRLPSAKSAVPPEKKKNKKRKARGFFAFILIMISCVTVFFVANAFSNILAFSTVSLYKARSATAKSFNVFMININNFEKEDDAKKFAAEIKLAGGAGYVMYDLGYNVIASAYLSSTDAQSVLEKVKLTYDTATVKLVEINRCELENIVDDEQEKCVQKALDLFKNTYKSLYDLSVKLDSSQITSADVKIELTALLESASDISASFRNYASKITETSYSLTQAKVNQVVELLNDLVESSLTSMRLSALLKNAQISALMLQNELALLIA